MSNVIHLAFRNENTESEFLECLACNNCRNKTFTMTFENNNEFPTVKCAACQSKIGCIGWVDE